MADWETVFSSYSNSGVYSIDKISDIRLVRKAAFMNGLDFTNINLNKVTDKRGFLKTVGRSLKFPSYFGMNWDALDECLTDLSWKPASGYVIVFSNFKSVCENMATEIEIIKKIFESSAQYWRQKKVQFNIFLS